MEEWLERRLERSWWDRAIFDVLAEEGKPMRIKDITEKILNQGGRIDYGETPESTIGTMLRRSPDLFRRVDWGIYELNIDPSIIASHSHTARASLAVVRPCSSYLPGDSEYKQTSDFVDSKVLSDLEKELFELIVNFRLPLVTGEVCFADILDNLEVEISEEEKSRPQLIDVSLLRNKLDELRVQIEEIGEDLMLSNSYGPLLERMHLVEKELEKLLDDANGETQVKVSATILGEFDSGSKPKPRVVIYYKNIQNSIKSDVCWWVMAGVFVHEMFHAWNYFKAGEKSRSVLAIDEPMVEFASLYFLKELEAFTSSKYVSRVRSDRERRVQEKQLSIGDVAAYGFGYYLFEKLSGNDADSIEWIETYSKKSAFINGRDTLVRKVEDALIPIYPFMSEKEVMGWFEEIIFDGGATFVTAGKSTAAKVDQDVSLRDLVLACIKTMGRRCFDAQELYVFKPIFEVCVPKCQNLESALKQQLDELVKEGCLEALAHDFYSVK